MLKLNNDLKHLIHSLPERLEEFESGEDHNGDLLLKQLDYAMRILLELNKSDVTARQLATVDFIHEEMPLDEDLLVNRLACSIAEKLKIKPDTFLGIRGNSSIYIWDEALCNQVEKKVDKLILKNEIMEEAE